jgi:hypothetical protein
MRTVFAPRSRHSTRDLDLSSTRDGERDTGMCGTNVGRQPVEPQAAGSRSRAGTAAPLTSASAPLEAAAAERVRASFARQGAMATLGAELAEIAAGRVVISLPIAPPPGSAGRLPACRDHRRGDRQRRRLRGVDADA